MFFAKILIEHTPKTYLNRYMRPSTKPLGVNTLIGLFSPRKNYKLCESTNNSYILVSKFLEPWTLINPYIRHIHASHRHNKHNMLANLYFVHISMIVWFQFCMAQYCLCSHYTVSLAKSHTILINLLTSLDAAFVLQTS